MYGDAGFSDPEEGAQSVSDQRFDPAHRPEPVEGSQVVTPTQQSGAKAPPGKRERFRLRFKRYFLAGLAAVLPIIISLFIIVWIYQTIAPHIVGVLGQITSSIVGLLTPGPTPESVKLILNHPATKTILSILLAIILVYVLGYFVSSYLGGQAFGLVDQLLKRFPIVKVIYPYAKQFTDSIFGGDKTSKFRKVVAIQYPRPGLYSLGFLVGTGVQELSGRSGKRLATIFVPSSPTPVMGYVVLVPEDEVIPLDLSVDQAFRMIISLGILGPSDLSSAKAQPLLFPKDLGATSSQAPAKE